MATYGQLQDQFWQNGPSPGALYGFPGGKVSSPSGPVKHTL